MVIVIAAIVWIVVAKWPAPKKVVIPAGWQSYQNADYGFSLAYPADWQVNTSQLQNDVPAVLFGNPIEGTTTYTLRVSMEKNDGKLSSAGYVENMLAKMQIDDQTNGTNTPSVMVQFEHASGTPIAANDSYELYNVFEFDHQAEQVYVAHDDKILVFDFPLAEANPNIASSTENNAIAHEILATLEFGK